MREKLDKGEQKGPCSVKVSESQGLVGHLLATRDPVLIRDLSQAGILVQTDPICPNKVVRSWLSVPIYKPGAINGHARGLIVVWSDEPDAFTDRELQLLPALAAREDLVIRNARLFDIEKANGRQGPLFAKRSTMP
jgi:GAF domain-containing protein